MLVFIIPVKSKQVSQSWQRLSKLFERCLKSVCSQTSSQFKVVVACHEKPETHFSHPNLHYIQVDFSPPSLSSSSYGQVRGSGDVDKAKKILAALAYVKQFNPDHIMVVDADDCVNKNIAEFVNYHVQCDGWYLKQGYLYEEGKKFIYLNTKNFYQSCGSSIIIKYNLSHLLFIDNYYNHHNFTLKDNITLQKLPFVGAIYVIKHGENQFMTQQQAKQLKKKENKLVFFLRKLLKYRPRLLTRYFCHNFGLYKIN